jgi:hypothetical protein
VREAKAIASLVDDSNARWLSYFSESFRSLVSGLMMIGDLLSVPSDFSDASHLPNCL